MQIYKKNRFTLKNFLISISIWFIVCLLIYLVGHAVKLHKNNKLIKSAIAISKDISSHSGLALLEKKVDHLSALIEQATKKPGVVFASIIDHNNKIIAYSDQSQFITLNKKYARQEGGIKYWRVVSLETHNVMNFLTPITFSNTKVGEVFISLVTPNFNRFFGIVTLLAVLSFLCIIVLFGAANYKNAQTWIRKKEIQPAAPHHKADDAPLFTCPLCCTPASFSDKTCDGPPIESTPILTRYGDPEKSIILHDLDKLEELDWFKQRIISKCVKIISVYLKITITI
jgi:Ca2+/Na+ antiporter